MHLTRHPHVFNITGATLTIIARYDRCPGDPCTTDPLVNTKHLYCHSKTPTSYPKALRISTPPGTASPCLPATFPENPDHQRIFMDSRNPAKYILIIGHARTGSRHSQFQTPQSECCCTNLITLSIKRKSSTGGISMGVGLDILLYHQPNG